MALYRVLKNLSKGPTTFQIGAIMDFPWLDEKGLEILQQVGAIARIAPPPMSALPGWKRRSKRLGALGIIDAEQFLEVAPEVLAEKLRVRPEAVERWRRETLEWLRVDSIAGR